MNVHTICHFSNISVKLSNSAGVLTKIDVFMDSDENSRPHMEPRTKTCKKRFNEKRFKSSIGYDMRMICGNPKTKELERAHSNDVPFSRTATSIKGKPHVHNATNARIHKAQVVTRRILYFWSKVDKRKCQSGRSYSVN
jgi:hypothetical protein